MPGPNSAPNGDRGLIRNHKNERFESCKPCNKEVEQLVWRHLGMKISMHAVYNVRDHAAKHGRLDTGKTR